MSRTRRYDVGFYAPWLTPRLVGAAETGGAETQLLLLSRALAEHGLAVCVVVMQVPGLAHPSSNHGVDVVVCPARKGGRFWSRLSEAAAVGAALRNVDADVIVARCAGYWIGLAGLSAKLLRRRFVFSSASLVDFDYASLLAKRSERLLFRLGIALADTIVVQTDEQAELCKQRFQKIPVRINSVAERARQSDHIPEAFLWASRIDVNKQPLEYVELARAVPEARFLMVARPTEGPENSSLWSEVVRAAHTVPNLELLPACPRERLLDLVDRAVAVVSTSGYEGMPNTFLESWARGIPALALNHDPDDVIVRHRLGACAKGERERLAEFARELWNDPSARAQYRSSCRAYVENHHSPDAVSAEWTRVLNPTSRTSQRSNVGEPIAD